MCSVQSFSRYNLMLPSIWKLFTIYYYSLYLPIGEHVYELAMYLDLLNQGCFPRWPQIFATAERAMERLRAEDPDLHDHLKSVAQINSDVNPKVYIIYYNQCDTTHILYYNQCDTTRILYYNQYDTMHL